MESIARRRMILIPRRLFILSVALSLAFVFVVPALAEYLGPDRTVLELVTVRDPDNDVWTLVNEDPPPGILGVCLIIHTCEEHPGVDSYSPICLWGDPPNTNPAESSSCTRAYKDVLREVTYSEATIVADLQACDLVNGWCTSESNLQLTGFEPVAGEAITLVEGTRNGEGFSCPGSACDMPLIQGENSFTFWALSTWGDSSQMGTLSAKVDSLPPSIRIPESWKIWEPLALAVDDGGTGIKFVGLTIHGGPYGTRKYSWPANQVPNAFIWDRYFGDVVAPVGDYPVTVQAIDRVGNKSTASASIVIPPPDAAGEPQIAAEADQAPRPTATPEQVDLAADLVPTGTPQALAAVLEDARKPEASKSMPDSSRLAEVRAIQPLWGAAAAALSYVTTSFVLSRSKAREKRNELLRREVERANAGRSIEKRTAAIWNRLKPLVAAIGARASTRSRSELDESTFRSAKGIYMPVVYPNFGLSPETPDGQDQATVERWRAIEDHQSEMQADEAIGSPPATREEAHARRRRKEADAYVKRQRSEAAGSEAGTGLILEAVPSFRSDPLGWAQTSIINLGRRGMQLLNSFTDLVAPSGDQNGTATDRSQVTGTPSPVSTPTLTPQAQPIPTAPTGTPIAPTPTAYQLQQSLNAKYGFCVYPLTDPDALENRIAEGGMLFGKGPFLELPAPPPGRVWEGYTTNKALISLKAFGLISHVFRREANLRALAAAEPNVEINLHYSIYEEGLRVQGVRVTNHHDLPIKVYWAEIAEGLELPDGSAVYPNLYAQKDVNYIAPGSTVFIPFEGLPETPFAEHTIVEVRVGGSSLEYERQYRQLGWRIDADTGMAEEIDPGWGAGH